MSTKKILAATFPAITVAAFGVMLALPVSAQQDDMQGMDMSSGAQMPAKSSSSAMPASEATTGQPMSGMDLRGTQMTAAQSQQQPPQSGMTAMSGMPKATQPAEIQHLHFGDMIGTRPRPDGLVQGTQSMDMSPMQDMDMSSMQGGNAPPDARRADYSDGYRYGTMRGMDMADNAPFGMLLLDQFEYADGNHGNSFFIDGEAYYGTDFNKVWVKAEGQSGGEFRSEALWDRATATYFSTQLGPRHDFGEGPGRTWAAFGVQGLAPYWFETEAFVYVGNNGRTAARFQAVYDESITQRLILQPKIEVNLYGKDDPQRAIGSGLSDVEFGLRLRYEIRREFAPYIGVVYRQRYGRTADFARTRGESADDLQFVAGLHVWF